MPWRIDVEDADRALRVGSYCSMVALALSVLLICATYYIRSVPDARHHVDRISWRLFTKAMWLQVIFATAYIVMYADRQVAAELSKSRVACSIGMMLTMGSRQAVSWLIASIAVNLAITVRWGIHAGRYRLERWYVIGSFALGYFPVIVGAARQSYGSSKAYRICYLQPQGSFKRYFLRALFGYYLGLSVATGICLIAVVIALTSIFKQARATSRLICLNAALSPQKTPARRPPVPDTSPASKSAAVPLSIPVPALAMRGGDALPVQTPLTTPADLTHPAVACTLKGRPESGGRYELDSGTSIPSDAGRGSEIDLATALNASITLPAAPVAAHTHVRARSSGTSAAASYYSEARCLRQSYTASEASLSAGEKDIDLIAALTSTEPSGQVQPEAKRGLLARMLRVSRVIALKAPFKKVDNDVAIRPATDDAERGHGVPRKISTYSLDDAFLSIALRVSIYPLVLVLTNTLYVTCDNLFYLCADDLSDALLPLYFANAALYAGRGAIFALIGFLVDPGFGKGFKAALSATRAKWGAHCQTKSIAHSGHVAHEGERPAGGAGDAQISAASEEDDMCSVRAMFGLPPRRGAVTGPDGLDAGLEKGCNHALAGGSEYHAHANLDVDAAMRDVGGTGLSVELDHSDKELEDLAGRTRESEKTTPAGVIVYRNPFDADSKDLHADGDPAWPAGMSSTQVSPKTRYTPLQIRRETLTAMSGLAAMVQSTTDQRAERDQIVAAGKESGVGKMASDTHGGGREVDVFGMVAVSTARTSDSAAVDGEGEEEGQR